MKTKDRTSERIELFILVAEMATAGIAKSKKYIARRVQQRIRGGKENENDQGQMGERWEWEARERWRFQYRTGKLVQVKMKTMAGGVLVRAKSLECSVCRQQRERADSAIWEFRTFALNNMWIGPSFKYSLYFICKNV